MSRPQQPNAERDALLDDWLTDTSQFVSATFMGFINPKSLAITTSGGVTVGFVIPAGEADKALALRSLVRDQIPVEISISIPESYKALLREQAS